MATSYSLSHAIRKIGNYDIILGGRQAIDGDTAQVVPQIAEKLNIPQVTYAEDVVVNEEGNVTVRRRLEHGIETVWLRCLAWLPLPVPPPTAVPATPSV